MVKMPKWAILYTVIISPFLAGGLWGIVARWLLIGPVQLFPCTCVALFLISAYLLTLVLALYTWWILFIDSRHCTPYSSRSYLILMASCRWLLHSLSLPSLALVNVPLLGCHCTPLHSIAMLYAVLLSRRCTQLRRCTPLHHRITIVPLHTMAPSHTCVSNTLRSSLPRKGGWCGCSGYGWFTTIQLGWASICMKKILLNITSHYDVIVPLQPIGMYILLILIARSMQVFRLSDIGSW